MCDIHQLFSLTFLNFRQDRQKCKSWGKVTKMYFFFIIQIYANCVLNIEGKFSEKKESNKSILALIESFFVVRQHQGP